MHGKPCITVLLSSGIKLQQRLKVLVQHEQGGQSSTQASRHPTAVQLSATPVVDKLCV
jgi:hypothetical protein